jgi:hypothetical protein
VQKPPVVYVLCENDYSRIESMIAALGRALETLFERRLIEPMSQPDDTSDFDDKADKVFSDYLLGPNSDIF